MPYAVASCLQGSSASFPVAVTPKGSGAGGPVTEEYSPISGQISRDAVQILREHTGRGPTEAKANLGDDVVTVVLGDVLTPSERTIAEGGEPDVVLAQRQALQRTMQDELVAM